MKTKLLIIGNGFDIHCGMDTQVSCFRTFFLKHSDEIFDSVNLGNNSPFKDYKDFLSFFEHVYLKPLEQEFWLDFERNLAHVQWSKIEDLHIPTPVLQACFLVLQKVLRRTFYAWITSVNQDIPDERLGSIMDDVCVVNFNYTETLEVRFGARGVYHLHGGLQSERSFYFGHSSASRKKPVIKSELDINYLKEKYLYDTDKHVDWRKFQAAGSFSFALDWEEIDAVIVLGHSMNEIDVPYFEYFNRKICNNNRSGVDWYVYCHSDNDEVNALALKEKLKGKHKTFNIERDYCKCASLCIVT